MYIKHAHHIFFTKFVLRNDSYSYLIVQIIDSLTVNYLSGHRQDTEIKTIGQIDVYHYTILCVSSIISLENCSTDLKSIQKVSCSKGLNKRRVIPLLVGWDLNIDKQ